MGGGGDRRPRGGGPATAPVGPVPLDLPEVRPVERLVARGTLRENLAAPELQLILDALEQTSWNCQRAAATLGINRATLYNKMKKYGIPPKSRHRVSGWLDKAEQPGR